MKKRLTALALVLCMLFTLMATASAATVDELPEDWKTNVIKATPDMYPNTDMSKPYTVKIYQVGDKPVDWDKIQAAINEQLVPFNTSIDTVFMSWADVATMYSLNLAGGADIDLIFTAPWEYMFTEAAKGSFYEMDEEFIAKYMPELDSFLHYRMIDVSSIKELTRRWYPKVYAGQPKKGIAHRALADIQESIQELSFYRHAIMVDAPGPDSQAISEAAAAALQPWS